MASSMIFTFFFSAASEVVLKFVAVTVLVAALYPKAVASVLIFGETFPVPLTNSGKNVPLVTDVTPVSAPRPSVPWTPVNPWRPVVP